MNSDETLNIIRHGARWFEAGGKGVPTGIWSGTSPPLLPAAPLSRSDNRSRSPVSAVG